MFGSNYVSDAERRRFFTRVASDSFASTIERSEVALKIVRVDDVVRVLEKFAVAFFAFSDRRFGATILRNISRDSDDAQYVVAFVCEW